MLASACASSPAPTTPTPSPPLPPASTPEPTRSPTPEPSPPPPKELTPLQDEDFKYTGFEGKLASVHIAMLKTAWHENKLTASWKLTNTCDHKILLNLLEVEAYDQMDNRGHHGFRDGDKPLAICPSLTYAPSGIAECKLWPSETVQFDSKWTFGPLSERVTITFICRHFDHGESSRETSPPFIVSRAGQ